MPTKSENESSPFLKHRKDAVDIVLNAATDTNLNDFDYWLEYIAVEAPKDTNISPLAALTKPNTPIRDKNSGGCLIYHIPETFKKGVTSNSNNSNTSQVKAKPATVARFISNWVQAWNCLVVIEAGDNFGKINKLYKSCCEFYFDIRIIVMISVLSTYIIIINIIELSLDLENVPLYVGTVISNFIFVIAYIWGATIYKGELHQSSLTGEESRMAREKINILSAGNVMGGGIVNNISPVVSAAITDGLGATCSRNAHITNQKACLLYVGAPVYAKYYEDGSWLPARITCIHSYGDSYFDTATQQPTYDVVYDRDNAKETAVKLKYVYLRPHSVIGKRQLLKNLCLELYDTLSEIVMGYRQIRGDNDPNRNTREGSISTDAGSNLEFSTTANSPVHNASINASVDLELNANKNANTEEVLKYYLKLQQPISCGYYEILDCIKKYSPANSSSTSLYNGVYVQSRLNRLTSIFLVIMILASPVINALLWYIIYEQRNAVHFKTRNCTSQECKANIFFFFASGCYVLSCLQQILLYNAIFMVFVGLLYGCDGVHYLSKNWQVCVCF